MSAFDRSASCSRRGPLPRVAFAHRVFSPFCGSPGGRGVSVLLLRTLRLGAGGWRCTLKRWVLLWSLLGPSAVAAGTFSISGFVFITPASGTGGAWLWCSEAPDHFPVTGKGAARTRGLCGVSRPDKHCLAPWGSAGPPQQQLPRPSHPRGGTLPRSRPGRPGLSTSCGCCPWPTPRPPTREKS